MGYYIDIDADEESQLFSGIGATKKECQSFNEHELINKNSVRDWFDLIRPDEDEILQAMLIESRYQKRRYLFDMLRSQFNKLRARREEMEIAKEFVS
jgi:hypothetical protein